MSLDNQVRQLLGEIEQLMQEQALWRSCAPELSAFESSEPFCIDSMSPEEWLQWVFIPRMRALVEGGHPLPTRIAMAPYFEEAFSQRAENHQSLIDALHRIDQLLNKETS
ncbi:YqcC family protein [Limnobaculum parvum]|uniref:YqcC family protein n=1 Tax=Limnobaculum parvum TaxID=2172103 RepID=A0A2Y9U188_9GAMM|nr:YqcC family protein [Limnobaculum parvum]AWH89481.1 YqcC family protein [Limnobaculum parvum]